MNKKKEKIKYLKSFMCNLCTDTCVFIFIYWILLCSVETESTIDIVEDRYCIWQVVNISILSRLQIEICC